jgi:hypothetical protein
MRGNEGSQAMEVILPNLNVWRLIAIDRVSNLIQFNFPATWRA